MRVRVLTDWKRVIVFRLQKFIASLFHLVFPNILTSLRPVMIWSTGVLGHEPSGTSVAPADSASSTIFSGLLTLKPFIEGFADLL